jgi:hypothetical protein
MQITQLDVSVLTEASGKHSDHECSDLNSALSRNTRDRSDRPNWRALMPPEIYSTLGTEHTTQRIGATPMTALLFLVGALLGLLCGAVACIRYMRHEVIGDICPRLRRINLQIDNLESALNLVLVTRYADLGSLQDRESPRLPPEAGR